MSISSRLASALLFTTGLCSPTLAFAQSTALVPGTETPSVTPAASAEPQQEEVEISIPGGDIVVVGRRQDNTARTSAQVVSVLSTAEIAKTGEGNIAGALGRVTGLSVVGNGFVYVRGLGDRYSLALLNGSPLPSPEPLKRVVPLDIFPTGVIASSLVQKSYSVNFPGEFGGGVINLTTKAIPKEPFLTIGGGISIDSETSGQLGYTYYGSSSDWTGFDNGSRDIPPALRAFLDSGARLSSGNVNSGAIAGQLVRASRAAVQRWKHLPPNFSASISGGKSFDLGASTFGLIASFGYSNKYQTRESIQQASLSADLSTIESSFRQVNTDQRLVVNGLLGLGLEFGDNKVRWTNLYVRDTIKQARLALGNRQQTKVDFMQQRTAWYERQLIDSQIVGEFKLSPEVKLDVRGGFANSQREAPYDLFFEYARTNAAADPFGAFFVNRLNNGNRGDAKVTFSDLNEDLWSASADLTYAVTSGISATVGGGWSDTHRTSSRRNFQFQAPSDFPTGVSLLRPDLLLAPNLVNAFKITLIETDEGNPAFDAKLKNYAGYAKLNAQINEMLSLDVGVRYEKAKQTVNPIQVFTTPGAGTAGTKIDRGYWLPAATLTYQIDPEMQLRISASKTIARPQFRELINQPFFDPENNRQYRGNPLLVDSQLYNGEARFEWYFAREQRFAVAAFYKRIDKPIEAFIAGGDLTTSYANAPKATLYGAEFEFIKYFDLSGLDDKSTFFATRRFVPSINYTYTKSKLKVKAGDTTKVFGAASSIATDYFRGGRPLTGQSDHIVNLQLGIEDTEGLSQQTLLIGYSSERVISRGLNGSPPQPDVIERPGLTVDFVARQGFTVIGKEIELKFEGRNLTGRKHLEFQKSGANRIDINSYKLGRIYTLSASVKL